MIDRERIELAIFKADAVHDTRMYTIQTKPSLIMGIGPGRRQTDRRLETNMRLDYLFKVIREGTWWDQRIRIIEVRVKEPHIRFEVLDEKFDAIAAMDSASGTSTDQFVVDRNQDTPNHPDSSAVGDRNEREIVG